MKSIPNDGLSPNLVPAETADWSEIQRFALTYDGYSERGSAECARIANNRIHETLDDLRTCLFFEQRRWRHFGEEPSLKAMRYIRSLVSQIRARIAEPPTKGKPPVRTAQRRAAKRKAKSASRKGPRPAQD